MEAKIDIEEVFNWKRVEETVQLAFEEHPNAGASNDDPETKNHDIHNLKKIEHDDAVLESDIHVSHQDGSKEIFEGQEYLNQDPKLTVKLDGNFDIDIANNIHLTIERVTIPPIIVQINSAEISAFEEAACGRDWKLVVQVMFAQRSHSSVNEKYKIYRGGILGSSRKIFTKSDTI